MAQIVKILSAVQETWVLSLVWEGPLKKEMAPHSSILTWRIARMEEPGELQSTGLQRVGCNDWVNNTYISRTDAFELWCWRRLLRVPLDCKEIQPVHSKGDRPWVFFGRNDAKAETPVLWPPHVKSWLIGKDSDAGRDWGQEEKGTTEDEMAGWHHQLNGREFAGRWWWTERPGVLRFMGLQRVRHDWVTDLIWSRIKNLFVRKGVLSSDQWIQMIDELHDMEMDLQIVL